MPTKLLLAWELPLVPTTPGFEALGVLGCDSFRNIRVVKRVRSFFGVVCHLNFSSVEPALADCRTFCFLCVGNVLPNLPFIDAVSVNVNVDVNVNVNFPAPHYLKILCCR